MNWLELSLEVESELADDIAAALIPFAAGGVAITSSRIEDDERSGHVAGPLIIRAYLRDDEALEENRTRLERALWYLGRIQELPDPVYTWIPDQDWQTNWRKHYKPLTVGERFLIVPAWESPEIGGRIPILINPGMAFGTGTHPTTRLCLRALEDILQPGDRVADLGAGSGILSIAARKCGAALVHGWDIDEHTISVAEQNQALNKVSGISFAAGSLPDLLASPAAPYDVVFANILAHILTDMLAEGLGDSVRPGGHLILSGILADQLPPIQKQLEALHFQHVALLREEEWCAPVIKKLPSR